jgi:hypothetical protein
MRMLFSGKFDQLHIGVEYGGRAGCAAQPVNAFKVFLVFFGCFALEVVDPGASMRIQIAKCLVFFYEVLTTKYQCKMLKNIGMIAGMKGVTVTEHEFLLTVMADM